MISSTESSYGSVASPVIDSWVIADHANKVIQDYRNDKLVDLVEGSGGDYFDYGFLEQENIGGLPNINTPDATEDYQFIIDPELGASRYPFGVLFRHFESEVVIGISLRHIAVNTEPTVKIGGKVFVKLPNKHQGEGVLFSTGGAAETATFREVKDGLFEFVGFAATRRIPNFNGGGTVRLDGASSSAVAFAGFQENTIVLRGVATVKYTPSYTGTGFISTLSGAAEAITASPDDLFGLFDFVGTAAERTSAAHLGSGSLFALSGAVEAVAVAEDKRNLLKISGNAGERFIPNFNGSGTLSVLSGAAESRTASPDDLFTLFDFTGRGTVRATIAESGFALLSVFGTTEPEVLTFAEQPFGTATISGNAGEKFVPNWIGSGTIATLSGAAESATFNPLERQILFSMGGIATEVFAAAPAIDGAEIKLSGTTSPEIRTFAEQPFGVIPVSGIAEVINVDVYLAEGTLFSGGFTSESVTFKIPPVRDGDILFRGSAVEAVGFNPPEETAHLLLSGEVVIPLRTFAEQPTVRVAISGVAIEKNTEAYLGTGVIFSNGFTSESVTRKLPEFTAHLNVTGLAEERATFREIFFGSLFKFRGSAGRALLTFAERPQTLSKISGVAATTRARDFVGEGNIATLSGAAEAVTFNPLERDLLFDVTGIAAERRTNVFVGSGQIKVYPEAADIRFIPNWNAEGVIPVSGIAVERVARDEVVQVNIGTFSGAAESVTFNPLEKDMLFSVGGRAAYRTSVSEVKLANARLFADDNNGTTTKIHVGSGTATLSGAGRIVITLSYIGDIRIGTFSGAAEAVTFNPLEKDLLFSASGIATLRSTRAYSGTGSLFAINGAAESRTVVPPADGLYAINGEASIVITLSHVGDGSLFSFVKGAEKLHLRLRWRTSSLRSIWRSSRENHQCIRWIWFYLLYRRCCRKSCLCTKSPRRCQHQWCCSDTKIQSIHWFWRSICIRWCSRVQNNHLRERRNLRLPRSSQTCCHQGICWRSRDRSFWSSSNCIRQSTLSWSSGCSTVWYSSRKHNCQPTRRGHRDCNLWRGEGSSLLRLRGIWSTQSTRRYHHRYFSPYLWYWIYQGRCSHQILPTTPAQTRCSHLHRW